jgi:UTP--glucose-1-phosphate uridylyltransferase
MSYSGLENATKKMREASQTQTFIDVFARFYHLLEAGSGTFVREADIHPLQNIDACPDDFPSTLNITTKQKALIDNLLVIKLNGGLGTTMGLEKAKSLLPVREKNGEQLTFLDIIIRNLLKMRKLTEAKLPLLFMNSNSTSADTMQFLEKYPELKIDDLPQEIVQHYEPKLRAEDLEPVDFPANPALEWCPPGHGDFYAAFYDSGALKKYLAAGYKYAFVSNSDNLGATLNPALAEYFADSGAVIMLELANKTEADIKGGHIVVTADGRKILREVAQIHPDDKEIALDPQTHPYFNTNSLWLNLEELSKHLDAVEGVLELPLIANHKSVDPKDKSTTAVIQMESAIASAVNSFKNAAVVNVPRSRFLPVKTHDDLALIKSEQYALDDNYFLQNA